MTSTDIVERLRALAQKWGAAEGPQEGRLAIADEAAQAILVLLRERDEAREALTALADRYDEQDKKVDAQMTALEEALKPFAEAIDRYEAEWDDKSGSQSREPDDEKVSYLGWLGDYFDMVTLGDFRRARRLLHPVDKQDGKDA